MSRNTTAKQLEHLTKAPMRPVMALFKTQFSLPQDSPPVDWTDTGTRMSITTSEIYMDDAEENQAQISVSTPNITLRPGIWFIHLHPAIINRNTAAPLEYAFAITNSDGSTVYAKVGDVNNEEVHSVSDDTVFAHVRHILHVTSSSGQVINFRAAMSGLANVLVDVQTAYAHIEKIGNANEA